MSKDVDQVDLDKGKAAMSRALGAAFLNHQVEQLEKTVRANNGGRRGGRGGGFNAGRGRGGLPPIVTRKRDAGASDNVATPNAIATPTGKPSRIVVDASVLIHALGQVKRWCREDRAEHIVIPLEALNTLDLLKKGSSALAMRARAASRVLEAQVGANPRIQVQRDEAFVPWNDLHLTSLSPLPSPSRGTPSPPNRRNPPPPPEWLRRTICCTRWEADQGCKVVLAIIAPSSSGVIGADDENAKWGTRADGELLRLWATKAGVEVLNVEERSSDGTGAVISGAMRGKRGGGMQSVPRGNKYHGEHVQAVGLVDRTPVSPIKVIRVLARGEKLEP